MMPALYITIWLSMLLFVAGETGRSMTPRGSAAPRWAWPAFAMGLVLAVVHTILALGVVHGWSHADAVAATAIQTRSVYGVPFGAGIYVNYLFLAVWLADAWRWRAAQHPWVRRRAGVWTLRAFYMLIIFNAAVVFAGGLRRIAGLLLVSWLVRTWTIGINAP